MPTKIDWCDETLNPLGWGCYGPGGTPGKPLICPGCYAKRWAQRSPYCKCKQCKGFVPHWHPEALEKPRRWKNPQTIFWQDMGDLWHPATPEEQIVNVLTVWRDTPQHHHISLTKNPERMFQFFSSLYKFEGWILHGGQRPFIYGGTGEIIAHDLKKFQELYPHESFPAWPPENWYFGVTVRNQEEADRLIPQMIPLATMGFKTFISYEPAWGPIDIRPYLPHAFNREPHCPWCEDCIPQVEHSDHWRQRTETNHSGFLSGVIAGGMTGPGAITSHPDWFRAVRDHCAAAGVPFMFKSWGEWGPSKLQEGGKSNIYEADPACVGQMHQLGKRYTGRILDGRTHDGLPWPIKVK